MQRTFACRSCNAVDAGATQLDIFDTAHAHSHSLSSLQHAALTVHLLRM